jgi:AcrR family transcriptional regulator
MAPPTRTPRAAWIEAGLRALAAGGPDAVRIEPIAKSLGVTRGGFYGQFEDRDAMLEAVLDAWERAAKLLPVELAVRDWSRRDPAVAERLRTVDNRRMQYLRSLFGAICPDEDEVEARAVLAFSLAIGHHFMATDHGTYNRAEAVELAVQELLR